MSVTRERLTRLACWAGLVVLAGVIVFVALRWVNPTSSAIYVSDSPDGKYRCAVFCKGVGNIEYEAGLFDGSWPHRELPGERTKWSNDSLASSDFRATWHKDGVDINYHSGRGDERDTVSGRDVGGKQQW